MSEFLLWPFEIVMVNQRKLTEQECHWALARIQTGSQQIDVTNEFQVSLADIRTPVHCVKDKHPTYTTVG